VLYWLTFDGRWLDIAAAGRRDSGALRGVQG
jgi:hypothetical protein